MAHSIIKADSQEITIQTDQLNPTATESKALQYTEWTWYDIAVALREIGYDPTPNEKERICRAIFNKKLNYLKGRA